MIDWTRLGRILADGTEAAINRLFLAEPALDLCAIGYTFELWNESPAFSLCANTHGHLKKTKDQYKLESWYRDDMFRWSSGDFEHCAIALSYFGEEWVAEYLRLDDMARQAGERLLDDPGDDASESLSQEIYDGLVQICCESLAEVVKRRVIPNWQQIDFNVAEYSDEIELIQARDQLIRSLIEKSS